MPSRAFTPPASPSVPTLCPPAAAAAAAGRDRRDLTPPAAGAARAAGLARAAAAAVPILLRALTATASRSLASVDVTGTTRDVTGEWQYD